MQPGRNARQEVKDGGPLHWTLFSPSPRLASSLLDMERASEQQEATRTTVSHHRSHRRTQLKSMASAIEHRGSHDSRPQRVHCTPRIASLPRTLPKTRRPRISLEAPLDEVIVERHLLDATPLSANGPSFFTQQRSPEGRTELSSALVDTTHCPALVDGVCGASAASGQT